MPLEKLTRARIVEALNLLGQLAEAEGVTLELCLYGGTAMMLAYDARENTRDVDAIVRPTETGRRLVAAVAERLGLHSSWLNDDVRRFVADVGTFAPLEIQELETAARQHLKITRASASYLLAMKCLACRPELPGHKGDIADLRFLIRKMGLRSLAEIEEHIDRFYPHDTMTTQARATILDLLPKPGESST